MRQRHAEHRRGAAFLSVILAIGFPALGQEAKKSPDEKSYIEEHTAGLPTLFRPAVGDHLHCSVLRKYPKNKLDSEKVAASLGEGYSGSIRLVNDALPAYHVVAAHRCSHDGRSFVHVTLQDDRSLLSLIVTRKDPGESFAKQDQVLAQPEQLPIRDAISKDYRAAAVETGHHLVYLVSDLSRQENIGLMRRIDPKLRDLLAETERH